MKLRANSQEITFESSVIETGAQKVADDSRTSGVEHQSIIVLDRENASVFAVPGSPGNNNSCSIDYFSAPMTGVNYFDKPGGLIIIGQIHGHPASNQAGYETLRTMSLDRDVPTAQSLQIPVYGVDAMYGKTGDSMNVHIALPSGEANNNVRKTIGHSSSSSYPNWGFEALRIYGRSH